MVASHRLSRRAWARLERRARRGHERDLLRALRELAEAGSPVVGLQLSRDGLGAVRLVTPTHHVVLVGVSERGLDIAAGLAAVPSGTAVVEGGRYRRAWWLTVSDGIERHHVLGAYLRIVPQRGPGSSDPDLPIGLDLSLTV